MRFLILLSRIFTSFAGITNPRPEEELKYAWMVFGVLSFMTIAVAGVAVLLVYMNRH